MHTPTINVLSHADCDQTSQNPHVFIDSLKINLTTHDEVLETHSTWNFDLKFRSVSRQTASDTVVYSNLSLSNIFAEWYRILDSGF